MKYLTALVAFLLPAAFAAFEDEVGKIDYHHALLGYPQQHTTFFHRPQPSSKATLIYSLSELGRLGAINPRDGSLVWRQQLQLRSESNNTFLFPGDGQTSVVSGIDGQIASWSAIDGKLIWSVQSDVPGTLVDLNSVELDSSISRKDLVALFHGEAANIVQRLEGKSGKPVWQYTDTSSDIPFKLSNSATKVFYISLHKTMLHGYKIHVTVLDSRTGQKLDHYALSSESDVSSPEDVHVEVRGAYPVIIWADKSHKNLKVNVLGSKAAVILPITNESAADPASSIVLHSANDISAPSHILVEYRAKHAHWGDVIHVESDSSSQDADPTKTKVKKAYEVARLAGHGTVASSLTDGKLYFTRVAKGVFMVLSSAENEIVERSIMKHFGAPGVKDHPNPLLAIGEVTQKADKTYAVRTATFLSSGDFALLTNGPGAWTRREALAYIVDAKFAELPQKQSLAQQLAIEDHSSTISAYIHRLKRHADELKHLPKYLQVYFETLVASIKGTSTEQSSKDDVFGFHKYVVVLTKHKRILALDVANGGNVVWTNEVEEWKTDAVPQIKIAQGIIRVKHEEGQTVFDLATGNLLRNVPSKEAETIASTSIKGAKVVEYNFVNNKLEGRLEGIASPIWSFSSAPGSTVRTVTPKPLFDPVASIGDVLGDRRVQYKYLNPNIVLVTATDDQKHILSVYLLDSVSGNTVWSTSHSSVDTTQPIPSTLSENWLSYSFTVYPSAKSPSRGHQLVFAKLYESSLPDDRGPLGAARNYSSLNPSTSAKSLTPHVIAQIFHVPEPISHLSVTQTRQGITSRLLLAVLPNSGSLIGIPLGAVDPRRPVNRDPTKVENEEGLFRYTPNLDIDPKWHLTHRLSVLGLDHVLASPATLESTSLLFAYGFGGDVFGTRVAPSFAFDILGKEFNKLQLIATVLALLVGVGFVAPMVGRKGNDMRWSIL